MSENEEKDVAIAKFNERRRRYNTRRLEAQKAFDTMPFDEWAKAFPEQMEISEMLIKSCERLAADLRAGKCMIAGFGFGSYTIFAGQIVTSNLTHDLHFTVKDRAESEVIS